MMLKLITKERGHFMSLVKSSACLISINAFKDIMIISTVVYNVLGEGCEGLKSCFRGYKSPGGLKLSL